MQPFSTEMRVFRNVALLSHTRVTCCGSPRAPKYSHEQGEQAERTPQGQGRVRFEPKRRSSITMQHGRHRKATLKLRESHRLDRGDFWGCLPNMYGPTTQYYLATRDRRAVPRAEIWRRAAISGKSASPPLCPAPDFQDRQGRGLGDRAKTRPDCLDCSGDWSSDGAVKSGNSIIATGDGSGQREGDLVSK